MAKVVLTPVTNFNNGSAVSTTNTNYERISVAFDNTLSRDGSSPNQMGADIDMNSNDLLNVQNITTQNISVNGISIPDLTAQAQASANAAAVSETNAAASAAEADADATALTSLYNNFSGGLTGQYLVKNSNTNFDFSWASLDATLLALAAYNTNGLLTQTAADTFVGRTLTGTANELTVTNGNGVAGNPTISLPAALTFTGKTVTGGTFTGITDIAIADGGTGQSTAYAGYDALTVKGTDIASAATTDIGAALGVYVNVTGTTTITSLGTKTAGVIRVVRFTGTLTLTHNANIILKAKTSCTTIADDVFVFVSEGAGVWRQVCMTPSRGSYTPTLTAGSGTLTTVTALSGFYYKTGQLVHFEATGTITTNGTGATALVFSLPFANSASFIPVIMGRETAVSGKALVGTVVGGGSNISLTFYDNTYPGANGAIIRITGQYFSDT